MDGHGRGREPGRGADAVSGKVDTQAQPDLAAASGISWIPALMVIHGSRGDEVARHIFPRLQMAHAAWQPGDNGTSGTR